MSRKTDQISDIIKSSIAKSLEKIRINQDILTVTHVEVTSDLKNAIVWIASNVHNPNIIQQLTTKKSLFSDDLRKLQLRLVPKLTFYIDESGDYADKINHLIDKINES